MLRIVVATARPSVVAFFEQMSRRGGERVSASVVGVSARCASDHAPAIAAASVAVVDGSIDSSAALELCGELRARRDDLPIAALFCCPHAASAELLKTFLAAGVGSFLDLQLSADQAVDALRGVARGEGVVRLQMTAGSPAALLTDSGGDDLGSDDRELLRFVSLGLTDHEIGEQMYLSRHTIKHRIERLRRRVGARNRVQLAALAGRLD